MPEQTYYFDSPQQQTQAGAMADHTKSPAFQRPTCLHRFKLFLRLYWKSLLVVVTPIILLPIPIIQQTADYRCMYIVLIMATYWVTEALPLPVTSMLPIVLFPMLGILDSDKTSQAYMKDTNMMFIGGLMIAAGVQHSKLHKRVALLVIKFIGCSHRRLNFGLTLVTMFISMWISNAAAVTMMVPIVEAVLEVLEQQGLGDMYIKKKKTDGRVETGGPDDEEPPVPSKITVCYFVSIAYAASIGGCGTLVGTATNLTFKGIYESRFHNAPVINFPDFMLYNVPLMILLQLIVWIWLQVLFMGLFRPQSEDAKKVDIGTVGTNVATKVVQEQYTALGPITFHEVAAGALFILAVFLYFLRSPGFMPGWADRLFALTNKKIKDSVTSMMIVILMFVIPMSLDFVKVFTSKTVSDLPTKPSSGVVTWKVLKDKIPWGLLFLLGGGFALAEGSKASGMSTLIGDSLIGLKKLPPVLILLVIIITVEFLTEFTSNVAIANIILPVLAEMAIAIEIHPLYLMLPATMACSMAFHMPVGTPPNAIVAGVANIPTLQMAIAGIVPTIMSALIHWAFFPIYGVVIFPETTGFPDWARK